MQNREQRPKAVLPTDEWLMAACASDEYRGWCVYCGAETEGVEPDARKYQCDDCGKPGVYGAEELLLQGLYTLSGSAPT